MEMYFPPWIVYSVIAASMLALLGLILLGGLWFRSRDERGKRKKGP